MVLACLHALEARHCSLQPPFRSESDIRCHSVVLKASRLVSVLPVTSAIHAILGLSEAIRLTGCAITRKVGSWPAGAGQDPANRKSSKRSDTQLLGCVSAQKWANRWIA